MKEKMLSRTNKIVALALPLFGIAAFFTSRHDLRFGSFARPQGRFTPTIFSVGLIIFSVINLVIELLKKNKTPEKLAEVNWRKWLYYTLLCGVYVFLIKKIGFTVDTSICLVIMLKLTGQKGCIKPVMISGIFGILAWALFTCTMNVPLPGAA